MKQLAVNKAKDARPEVPFAGGTSIEYALHMSAFDAATDNDALDAKDKLFELTKWFMMIFISLLENVILIYMTIPTELRLKICIIMTQTQTLINFLLT